MCGIVAYLGSSDCKEILLAGLQRLEYRGYDSAGLAVIHPVEGAAVGATSTNGAKSADGPEVKRRRATSVGDGYRIKIVKAAGKVKNLAQASKGTTDGTLGIAHTRWATHGPPNDVNAHPHLSFDGSLCVVHNGIVENFKELRTQLQRKGYVMASDTDTELIAHLIADVRKQKWMPLEEAVRQALTQIQGAFGLAVLSVDEPDMLIGARRGSPLILGIGDSEYLLASDAAAVIERTKHVCYLNDGDMAIITRAHCYQIKTLDNVQLCREVQQLELSLQAAAAVAAATRPLRSCDEAVTRL